MRPKTPANIHPRWLCSHLSSGLCLQCSFSHQQEPMPGLTLLQQMLLMASFMLLADGFSSTQNLTLPLFAIAGRPVKAINQENEDCNVGETYQALEQMKRGSSSFARQRQCR